MRYAWTVAAIRAAEEAAPELATGELMRRAAEAVAREAGPDRPVLILAGPGNNGADGLWAGERLARAGASVAACAVLGGADDTAAAALTAAGGSMIDIDDALAMIGPQVLIIDAILGIGARPGLRGAAADAARLARERGGPVLAVDLPSGLDADGAVAPGSAFRADRTVTFGGRRLCHLLRPAADACGEVVVADIGIDLRAEAALLAGWQAADVARAWPVPGAGDDKYSRGVLGIDTGSARYPGAAVLSCTGAAWSGAGMIRYAGPGEAGREVVRALPNVTIGTGRVQAWLLGSGWGERPDARTRVDSVLALGLPTVLDADAIAALPRHPLSGRVLLTPHAGELARLLDTERAVVEADPIAAGRRAAEMTGACVLLKGTNQFVLAPGHDQVWLAAPGPAWTGQAGSGDTLAGICGTLLAAGLPAADAGVAAASLQAITAEWHPGPYPPQALASYLPATIAALLREAR